MRKYIISGLLLIWLLVTLLAIAGMYRLWWQRERVLYWGKDIIAQRSKVLQKAGILASILKDFEKIDSKWPIDIHYNPSGDHNTLSYLTYLLIPRIPSGKSEYHLKVEEGKVEFYGHPSLVPVKRPYADGPKVQGLILSVLFVSGFAYILKFVRPSLKMSMPELGGLSFLFLMMFALLSIRVFNSAGFGFWLYAAIGVIGWALFLFEHIKKLNLSSAGMGFETGLHFLRKFFLDNTNRKIKRQRLFVALLSLIGVLIFVWSLLMAVVVVPDDWDAWAIWGAKAKVLSLAQGPLDNVTYFGHPDYPLLWPVAWAFSGWSSGGWEEHWSRGWGTIFFLLSCWEIAVIVKRNTHRWDIGILGGTMFASIPLSPLVASWSYAEAPFWLMTVGCFGCLQLWRDSGRDGHLLWAALLAAAAAYTKNEGILFFAVTAGWLLLVPKHRRLRSLLLFSGVVILLYAPWYYWVKVVSGFDSHATAGLSFSSSAMLRALDRLPKALGMILNLYCDIKQWNVVLWSIGAAWLIALWKTKPRADLVLPIALLLGYLVIVVFHQADIYWQVGTAWNRLTLQVLPLALVVLVPRIWLLHKQNSVELGRCSY